VSIAAVVVYVIAFLALARPYDSIVEWLGLAALGGAAWIFLGWMVEIMTLDARGHFTFVLGWEYPVVFAIPVAVGIAYTWHQSTRFKAKRAANRYARSADQRW
jgi:hypothetical protein